MQLGRLALALAVFRVGPVEASVGEPVEPAPSLAQQLQSLVTRVTTHPRSGSRYYFVCQELVDAMRAVVGLVLENLFEFVHGNDDCRSILKGLTDGFGTSYPESDALKDYACPFQDLLFLCELGNCYRIIL